jgi:hypothetical protein
MTSYPETLTVKNLKKIISDPPTLIFSRYETGTTGIFFTPKPYPHPTPNTNAKFYFNFGTIS